MSIRPILMAGAVVVPALFLTGCDNNSPFKKQPSAAEQQAAETAINNEIVAKANLTRTVIFPGTKIGEACNSAATQKLPKPFTQEQLNSAVKKCIDIISGPAKASSLDGIKGIKAAALNGSSLTNLATKEFRFIAKA